MRQKCQLCELSRFTTRACLCATTNINATSVHLRHPHGKALDDHILIERFKDISRDQGVVNARVLVLLQFMNILLADVAHGDGCTESRRKTAN